MGTLSPQQLCHNSLNSSNTSVLDLEPAVPFGHWIVSPLSVICMYLFKKKKQTFPLNPEIAAPSEQPPPYCAARSPAGGNSKHKAFEGHMVGQLQGII